MNATSQPKKRGRRPLTDEEKQERQRIKLEKKSVAKQQSSQTPLHISFLCTDSTQESAARVLPAAEVIQLLNTSNQRSDIPERVAATHLPPPAPKNVEFMDESDDDEDKAVLKTAEYIVNAEDVMLTGQVLNTRKRRSLESGVPNENIDG